MPEGLNDAVFNGKNHTAELINVIRLKWNSPIGVDRVCILVEGQEDYRVYGKLFDATASWLEPTGGKDSLKTILERLTKETKQIIGIQDADFSHLENKEPEIEGLFFTDYHDIEMTMFKAEGILKNIFSEYGKIYDMKAIWGTVMENASYIGYIRWYNEQTAYEYIFNGVLFNYDITNPLNEKPGIIEILNNQPENKKQELKSKSIENFIESHRTDDYYNLCNGHDVIKLLMKILSQGERNLYTALRLSYQNHHFAKTKLYRDIVLWQEKFGYSIVNSTV
jgi:hypothetical protein